MKIRRPSATSWQRGKPSRSDNLALLELATSTLRQATATQNSINRTARPVEHPDRVTAETSVADVIDISEARSIRTAQFVTSRTPLFPAGGLADSTAGQ